MLSGKSIIVAGGSSGIGLESVLYFLHKGASVIAIGKDASIANIQNNNLVYLSGDLQEEGVIQLGIQKGIEKFGLVNGLFHVAGGSGRSFGDGPLHALTPDAWDKTMRLNAGTVMLTNQAFIRHCLVNKQRGAIVNLSSALTKRPFPAFFGTHAYTAAKAAVEGLSLAAASMYAKDNISINVISPGLTDTPMARRALADDKIMLEVCRKQQLDGGRAALPADVVPMAALLLSDEGRFITGQNIRIDGGWSVTENRNHE